MTFPREGKFTSSHVFASKDVVGIYRTYKKFHGPLWLARLQRVCCSERISVAQLHLLDNSHGAHTAYAEQFAYLCEKRCVTDELQNRNGKPKTKPSASGLMLAQNRSCNLRACM